ncbi:hypothetical protein NDU88_003652 [Pleurodeles waltl]|uniref:Gypsy retrotransposon integrase-like protein 1 n=1 Tax=Pleurodeles waltl TaxID=8319 RepID=A0AAV7UGW7_PLEWA|nr:hypothetical protein NDU88_003652 [Pleurodeles waltl]
MGTIVRRNLPEHLEVKATDDFIQVETADMRVSDPDRVYTVTLQLEGDIERTISAIFWDRVVKLYDILLTEQDWPPDFVRDCPVGEEVIKPSFSPLVPGELVESYSVKWALAQAPALYRNHVGCDRDSPYHVIPIRGEPKLQPQYPIKFEARASGYKNSPGLFSARVTEILHELDPEALSYVDDIYLTDDELLQHLRDSKGNTLKHRLLWGKVADLKETLPKVHVVHTLGHQRVGVHVAGNNLADVAAKSAVAVAAVAAVTRSSSKPDTEILAAIKATADGTPYPKGFLSKYNYSMGSMLNAEVKTPGVGVRDMPNKIVQPQLITAAHEGAASAHAGVAATISLLQARYWWPGLYKETKQDTMASLGVQLQFSSPFQPEGNSVVDRLNRDLKQSLTARVIGTGRSWLGHLYGVQRELNNLPRRSLGGRTSYECLFGTQMYVPDLDGPGVEAADTPFDINDCVTVLQDLQQFREDNSSASAASTGIKDEPVTPTGWIPRVGDLVREKVAVKKEFGPSYRAPVPVLGVHGTRTVILLPLQGAKGNHFVSIDNVKLQHVADSAQQTKRNARILLTTGEDVAFHDSDGFFHVAGKQKAPIGSSGCTSTGAKSNFQADRDGALLGYRSREASVKKLPSDLVFILKFFFTGTNLPVESDLLEPLSGYAMAHSQTCALRLRLLREAVYEIPFLEEDVIVSFIGPAQDATLDGSGALEHTCSLIVFGVDFPVLTSAEVEDLLLLVASI